MLEHGGNLAHAAKKYGIALENWLDLSTGINPQGYPAPAIPAQIWQRLPMDDDGLLEAARDYYGCSNILATAGSQAALQVLPTLRKPCVVAMLDPMYKEHAHAWRMHGHQVCTFADLHDDSTLSRADVVLLCNPNNPTAASFCAADLLNLHRMLQLRDGWLIVDEAFIDCAPEHSIAQHTAREGLFVLRSLGKFFGLAGLRVGFLLAEAAQLDRVQQALGPWSISGASRYIAKHALADHAWQQATRIRLQRDSQRLAILLQANGLTPLKGTALFQLVVTPQFKRVQLQLAERGIWLRMFEEIGALRFGLPAAHGWEKLQAALEDL